jgi:hypothetical protein
MDIDSSEPLSPGYKQHSKPLQQQWTGLHIAPFKTRRNPGDPFFDAGNVARALLCKLSVFFSEDEALASSNITSRATFTCGVGGCAAEFSNTSR